MKIYPTRINSGKNPKYNLKLAKTTMQGIKRPPNKNFEKYKKPTGYGAAALSLATGIYCLFRGNKPTEYTKALAKSMSADLGQNINPKNLAPVISGKQLLKKLPKLSKNNFTFTPENIENGVYLADLHSHSVHSDGKGQVQRLLDDAAKYADKLYSKTKHKFIFALTDHDTMEGCKEALQIIARDPEKYKNLQFVPGIEVSFAHSSPKSSNSCEMSEVLVFGVNPYSEKVSNFINGIKTKRTNMAKNFISEAEKKCPLTKFSFDEFSNYYEFEKYGNLMNIHWRAYHYVQTKHAATIQASKTGQNPQIFFDEIMSGVSYPSIPKLRESGRLSSEADDAKEFRPILDNFAPHFENGKIIAASENTFEEVIDTFKDEKDVFMAFAHPFYFTEYTGTIQKTLKYFTDKSKGLIKASESYHQAYTQRVNMKEVETIQEETEKLNLLNLGGRDNHEEKLF